MRTAFATDFPVVAAAKPGPNATRDALLDRGVRYLDRAHSTPVRNANLDSEVAAAYQQFGILQENTADPKAGGREAAVQTYQKASAVLVTLAAENPDDARARERLEMVNQRIVALGGQAVSIGSGRERSACTRCGSARAREGAGTCGCPQSSASNQTCSAGSSEVPAAAPVPLRLPPRRLPAAPRRARGACRPQSARISTIA